MLHVVSAERAFEIVTKTMPGAALKEQSAPLQSACGRVLAKDVVGAENVPSFDRSTMDGFALRAADTFGAGDAIPAMLQIVGEVGMGQPAGFSLAPGQCARISTGGMLPEGADAVLPVEYTDVSVGELCLCYKAVSPLQNVTRAGDDVAIGQTVLKKGTLITPPVVGVLAAMGLSEIPVFCPPRVGVLSTGNEIVPISAAPCPGQVRDVNAGMLAAMCASYGCESVNYGIVKDDEELLLHTLRRMAEENDIVLLSGGSSAGAADCTAAVIGRLGSVYCHGVAVKPGKPTVLGQVCGKAAFGLPGHPAACYFMTSLFVRAYTERLLCMQPNAHTVPAALTEHVSSNHGREEFLCVRFNGDSAAPVYGKSGVISQLSAADGFIVIPRDCEGLAKGAQVQVHLF